ncbi:low-density lipoprotein receptor-related protein 4-like [Ostrea edulis]|uniref:low-density lipoprotein receptor-related protein 4-like n=1 Tax=Ostrea edulis TaxID=37623 RepID=UPI00209437BB|nr:low-density lipoprotein receptor-related protein 4-like [Ostrea edulis]XP_048730494.1 low-density lipoprotein receptor-related protein 4-like [Ostrea edulis]
MAIPSDRLTFWIVVSCLLVCLRCSMTGNEERVMVFANRTHIHWVNQNQKEHHIMPLANITEAKYVDFDPVENMIYWSDVHHGGSISKASLCAQGQETVVSDIFLKHVKAAFVSIAVDSIRRTIYWTNSASDLIEMVNLDGSNRTVVAEHDMGSPIDVEVDSSAGFVYWLDAGIKPKIESCSLTGMGRRVLVDLSDQYPSILELDVNTQALYWNDKNSKQLFTARMDGSHVRVLKSGIPHITGIFIEGNYIYWTDWWNKDIERIPITGDDAPTVILSPVKDMEDLISIKVIPDIVHCPPRPAYKFKAHNTIVNRTVETTFTWKAAYGWKIPQYFELDQRDSDSQIWVEVYKIAADGERSVTLELEHSQEYHFRIRACNVYGCSRKNTPEVKLTTESITEILSPEEHFDAVPILMKAGIILGGVLVFIGVILCVWGYWRSRKRKQKRYRAVRYSVSSYVT